MHSADSSEQELRDAQAALTALAAAQNRAQAAGHSLLVVQGNQLVRVSPQGSQTIKTITGRQTVASRVKHKQK